MTHLLTLLLVTQVATEWVEISQQHYRKPIRTHSPFTTPKVTDVEETTKTWTYNNRSVTEYNWNKTPARPPNIGNIKRVQHIGSTAKPERVKQEDDLDLRVDFRDYELRPNYGPTRATIDLHHKQKDMAERILNLGNIKRGELNDSPVKSPAVNNKGDRDKYSNNRHDEANEYEHEKNTEASRRVYVNKIKHHSTERTATFPPDDDEDMSVTEEVTTFNTERPKQVYNNHTTVRDFYSTKPTFITETEDFTSYETTQNRFYKIAISTEKPDVFTTEIIETEEKSTINSSKRTKPTFTPIVKANKNKVHQNVNDFKAESNENRVYVFNDGEKTENPIISEYKTKPKGNNDQTKADHESEKENSKEIKDKKDKVPTTTKTDKNKVNTMENVIKFMRVVADTISKNSRRSFGGKMQYLQELKEFILANIEERIDTTWPDDDSAGARRRSRSAHASPRGHVQFPSSESALMTISFLTFAVFLIKLVLQVIQTYKNKAMVVAPLMVASGRKIFTHHGHH